MKPTIEFLLKGKTNKTGKPNKVAQEHMGKVYRTRKGMTGIVCGYMNQNDWWMYWVELHEAVRYDVQITTYLNDWSTLSAENVGTATRKLTEEEELKLLNIAREFTDAIVRRRSVIELGEEDYRALRDELNARDRQKKQEAKMAAMEPVVEKTEVVTSTVDYEDLFNQLKASVERFDLNVEVFPYNGKNFVSVTPAR